MAGKTLADVAAFDLYSCFPSAVEVAMKEIGIAEDDPRPISVTGGLPFFGGPGQQLRHPLDRRDDERGARASPARSAW